MDKKTETLFAAWVCGLYSALGSWPKVARWLIERGVKIATDGKAPWSWAHGSSPSWRTAGQLAGIVAAVRHRSGALQ